jgi:hypothetical protein
LSLKGHADAIRRCFSTFYDNPLALKSYLIAGRIEHCRTNLGGAILRAVCSPHLLAAAPLTLFSDIKAPHANFSFC